jgi:hypothetical protein
MKKKFTATSAGKSLNPGMSPMWENKTDNASNNLNVPIGFLWVEARIQTR